jgi:superfamily II DNA or RNA helicase
MWSSTHVPDNWRGAFVDHDNINDIATYLRAQASELGGRILELYSPLQSTTDEVPAELSTLLRTPLPAQADAIGGLAKYLKSERAARIVAECGAGKTYMALGLAHVLQARTILVMCPSYIAKKWAREAIQTIPFVRAFLVEDMRNGGESPADTNERSRGDFVRNP